MRQITWKTQQQIFGLNDYFVAGKGIWRELKDYLKADQIEWAHRAIWMVVGITLMILTIKIYQYFVLLFR